MHLYRTGLISKAPYGNRPSALRIGIHQTDFSPFRITLDRKNPNMQTTSKPLSAVLKASFMTISAYVSSTIAQKTQTFFKPQINNDLEKIEGLIQAIRTKNPEQARALLAAVPEAKRISILNYTDTDCDTPFAIAIKSDNIAMVQILLDSVPEAERITLLNQSDPYGKNLFHWTTMFARPAMMQAILEKLPEDKRTRIMTQGNYDRQTPFHWAALDSDSKMIPVLLAAVPKDKHLTVLNQPDKLGRTPLNLAAHRTDPEEDMMRVLVQHGAQASMNQPDKEGYTPLYRAAKYDRLSAAETLLALAPKHQRTSMVSQPTQSGCTPLHMAIKSYNPYMMQTMIAAVPPADRSRIFNQLDGKGRTPLRLAEAMAHQVDGLPIDCIIMAGLLLAYGANPNQLSDAFRQQVQAYGSERVTDYSAQLVKRDASPAQAQQATNMLRWAASQPDVLPEMLKSISGQFNQFLKEQAEQLITLNQDPHSTKAQKFALLDRVYPILRSEIPITMPIQLIKEAENLKHIPFLKYAMVADPNFPTFNAIRHLK